MKIDVRRLSTPDLEPVFALRLAALAESPAAFLTSLDEERARGASRYAEMLADSTPDRAIYGAFVNDRLVGTVGIRREARPKTKHKAHLWGMFVDPAHRKLGLGRQLVAAAVTHAREQMGAAAVYLGVEADNEPARRLYESFGFKVWGIEPRAMSADPNGGGASWSDEKHMVLLF